MRLYLYDPKTKLLQSSMETDDLDTVQNSTIISPFSGSLSTIPKWDDTRWIESGQALTLTAIPDLSYTKQLSDLALQIAKLNAAAKGSGK